MTVHVSSAYVGRFGRRAEGLLELLVEAGEQALEGVGRPPIDALVVGTMASSVFGEKENLTARLAERLSLDEAAGYRVEAASATGAAVFHAAWAMAQSPDCQRVLAVAGEKMTGLPTSAVSSILARSLSESEEAVGATMPALAAIVAQRYILRHGSSAEAFDWVTVRAREGSAGNPQAQFRERLTPEQVASSRPVALPLRLLHCSAITDGAAAAVLEKGKGPATVLGLGQGFDRLSLADRPESTEFRATQKAARRAYEMAHCTPGDLGIAEIHDAFAPFAILDLEDLGIAKRGEGAAWFREPERAESAGLSVNPSGGLLGRGHPVGASGLAGIVEVARRLRGGTDGGQTVSRGKYGLAQSIGGLGGHNFVTILGEVGS